MGYRPYEHGISVWYRSTIGRMSVTCRILRWEEEFYCEARLVHEANRRALGTRDMVKARDNLLFFQLQNVSSQADLTCSRPLEFAR